MAAETGFHTNFFFLFFFKSTSQHLFGIGHLDHFEGVQNSSIHRQV